jgi:choice-of-anchor A domain-containing protein
MPIARRRSYLLGCWASLLLSAAASVAATAPTLGNAAKFAALSTKKAVVLGKKAKLSAGIGGGTSISLGADAVAAGDVIANPMGIALGKAAAVDGTCVTQGAKVTLGKTAVCFNENTAGASPDLATMTAAIGDLATFETALAALPPTQMLPAVSVAKKATYTITDTPGLNVVSVPSVKLKGGATLQLSGSATDTLIVEIAGKLTIGAKAHVVLANGLTASRVIVNVGEKAVTIPKSTQLSATLVVPNGGCTVGTDAEVEGALLCADKVTLAAGATVAFAPFSTVTPPSAWVLTGSLNVGRAQHTQTTLADGRVLVAGGFSATGVETSAELYDATGTTATATGSLLHGRVGHTATLLPNGKVLLVGGEDAAGNSMSSAELYDPSSGKFSDTGSLGEALVLHTAVLLANGKVLVAGGDTASFTPTADAELYDPATGQFSDVGQMSAPRDEFVGGLFTSGPLSGQVIVAGGGVLSPTMTADLFNPATNMFSATGSLAFGRAKGVGAMLETGEFLVAGGGVSDGDDGASSELYDPTSHTFGPTATSSGLTSAHITGTAIVRPDGLVAMFGGANLPSGNLTNITNIYDPSTGNYVGGPNMNQYREEAAASLLDDGQILVTGGYIGGVAPYTTSAELLQ